MNPLSSWKRSPPPAGAEKATAELLRAAGEPAGLPPEAQARIGRRLRESTKRGRLASFADTRTALVAAGLAVTLVVASASVVLLERPVAFERYPASARGGARVDGVVARASPSTGAPGDTEATSGAEPPRARAVLVARKEANGAQPSAAASPAALGAASPALSNSDPPASVCRALLSPTDDEIALRRPDSSEFGDMSDPAEQRLFDRARCRLRAGQREGGRSDLRAYLAAFPSGRYAAEVRALLTFAK